MRHFWYRIHSSEKILNLILASLQLTVAFFLAKAALDKYSDSIRADRVNAAFKQIDKEEGENIIKADKELSSFWDDQEPWLIELSEEKNSTLKQKRYMEDFPKGDYPGFEFGLVLRNYHKAAICARRGVCDSETLCDFIFPNLQAFRENWRPILTERESYRSAKEIGIFAQKTCNKHFDDYCDRNPLSIYCQPLLSPQPANREGPL